MLPRAPQVAVMLALVACDSPARVKPWRHAPDPTKEAASAPVSPVLAEVPSEADVHAARGHTLRIHVDAEPGRLSPIVAPSVWARRITLGTIFEPLLRYVPPDGATPAHYAPLLPMHVYDGSLLAGGALVGTGPWKLASNKGGIVHLARNDKYWGPPPAIADVELVYQPDAAVALTDAKHGELDIVPALIPAHW